MTEPDPRRDRLYDLLPAIHRVRDAERGYPLKALLAVIAEQVNIVEDDIDGLYDNWFIETAQDWAVPYIGALVGYRPAVDGGLPPDADACERPRALVPRREIAGLIAARRRKGTLALLEELARDVSGWPTRAVEFYRTLGWNQNINHAHLRRHRVAQISGRHAVDALDLLDTPFDRVAHAVDVRRGGRNIPNLALYAWRLRSYCVTGTAAYCVEESGPHCFTFSVLGQDAPLYRNPEAEADPAQIAGEANLPAPIRRRAFKDRIDAFYGAGRSLLLWVDGWGGWKSDAPVPASLIIAADLSGWRYDVPSGRIAVDPVLGRFAFAEGQLPKRGVRVSYCYGFPADIGGGEYARPRRVQAAALGPRADALKTYVVGKGKPFKKIGDALKRWHEDDPDDAVIELADSAVYVEPLAIDVRDHQSLAVRAADRRRPVIRLIDWQTDLADALGVTLGVASRFVLDGVLVTGRPLHIAGRANGAEAPGACPAEVIVRHCTLVPGWALDCGCDPRRPAEPSLELLHVAARVRIEHSIVGAIVVHADRVRRDPLVLDISDSIVDATSSQRRAIGAPGSDAIAHVVATIRRSTIFGIVEIHALLLGENSIFSNCVNVARRQLGCLRYSYVPAGCRTPRRHRCQPDGVIAAARLRYPDDPERREAEVAAEKQRVRPRFTARRYGKPAYAQLAQGCAAEIVRGADDDSEMGVYHDLYQPQRAARLRAQLAEYTPAGLDAALVFVT